MVVLSYVLGEHHRERATGEPYEGGMPPTGSARARIPVTYYLVAMIFVIFDLEVAFLYPWAVAARELGWRGLVSVFAFLAVLVAALVYLWRTGALELATRRERHEKRLVPRGSR
jgi:NADH-quinone oxidoreductase subunit A